MKKALIFDSGALITLSMSGLLYLVEELKKNFEGEFIITPEVKYEVIDRPIKVPRFKLGALWIRDLLDKRILVTPQDLGISNNELSQETSRLMKIANSLIRIDNKPVQIVSPAEISCISLAKELQEREVDSLIVVDERTTRIIVEKPNNLAKIISHKMHRHAKLSDQVPTDFKGIKIIRSPELVYVAWKKDLLKTKGPEVLEAALFSTKYKGSAISFEEIKQIKKF